MSLPFVRLGTDGARCCLVSFISVFIMIPIFAALCSSVLLRVTRLPKGRSAQITQLHSIVVW